MCICSGKYHDPENPETLKHLNKLCVRLVFCLYAEDAGIFGRHMMFHDYLAQFAVKDMRKGLTQLFRVLNQKDKERDPYLKDDDPLLAAFPYVNGGLFADETVIIPPFTEELRDLLLRRASADFDWSEISPTIFGAVFESTLNPETRRSGGMHYTSHKVIDPLFLNELTAELDEIKAVPVWKTKEKSLLAFQKKLASLEFLDPAAGSGNFLTESYLSLRRLENEVISELYRGQISMDAVTDPIQVSIAQFHGIDKTKLNYIMGNPPFVGGMYMSTEQKSDIIDVMEGFKSAGELDYVAGWYKKSVDLMEGTSIHAAFVSTNSICQGQQATTLWANLLCRGVIINFGHQTFIWDSEASIKAHVHCIIVGFSYHRDSKTVLYSAAGTGKLVSNINQYLTEGPTVIVESRSVPLCNVPPIRFGSMPRDGGGFILSEEEKEELIKKEPTAAKWIHPYLGAEEFLKNKKRYCLWLLGANPAEIAKCPTVKERVQRVRDFRLASKAAATRKFADTPSLFCQIAQPSEGSYIPVPETSSGRRKYIPMGFLSCDVIASNLLFLIPNADLYHFGILESNVHMAWMRTVCGRLKSDYRYSKDIVYNNFPWPEPTDAQKAKIEQTAQAILDARALYPDASLAVLYDDNLMPPELRKAHHQNDRAVWEAYGKAWPITSESDCVAALMKMYQELIAKEGN